MPKEVAPVGRALRGLLIVNVPFYLFHIELVVYRALYIPP